MDKKKIALVISASNNKMLCSPPGIPDSVYTKAYKVVGSLVIHKRLRFVLLIDLATYEYR